MTCGIVSEGPGNGLVTPEEIGRNIYNSLKKKAIEIAEERLEAVGLGKEGAPELAQIWLDRMVIYPYGKLTPEQWARVR